ncbi:flagellar biosynthetic protein FliO [Clostridium sp. D2Q-14]|uniref:flagellar biosynthetic protein FliO n=1 Tax=Anaeromonas gelatinilytica TaxID=2683194 RepID=UPI00193C1D53|nr:flagellar biosynthetic protein FliO [Anaeromonas gelatinilytica]MBS4536039.1 flagellar biosynthetic protein FliO [Anaeromonas gelatinilytica]
MLLTFMTVIPNSNMIGNIFRMIFAIFVFLIILALAYFTSRFIAKSNTKLNNGRNMIMLDALNLGNNKKIIMVKIIDDIYILGVSNSQVNIIDKLDSDISIENLTKEIDTKPNFENFLKDKLSMFKGNKSENEDSDLHEIDYTHVNNLKKKISYLKKNKAISKTKDED